MPVDALPTDIDVNDTGHAEWHEILHAEHNRLRNFNPADKADVSAITALTNTLSTQAAAVAAMEADVAEAPVVHEWNGSSYALKPSFQIFIGPANQNPGHGVGKLWLQTSTVGVNGFLGTATGWLPIASA